MARVGCMVIMINESYDSFISKGGVSSTLFFCWEILPNSGPTSREADKLVFAPFDVLTFPVTYDAIQHGTTSVDAKHAFACAK